MTITTNKLASSAFQGLLPANPEDYRQALASSVQSALARGAFKKLAKKPTGLASFKAFDVTPTQQVCATIAAYVDQKKDRIYVRESTAVPTLFIWKLLTDTIPPRSNM